MLRLITSSRFIYPAVISCAAVAVIVASVVQGTYNLDPHHWGLMLSNAVDFDRGRVPYKDIFIQYGFLTTLLEYVFFITGKNLASIIAGVALCYALGLVGIYVLTLHFTRRRPVALYAFLTAVLVHPLAIYPWSNYVAFPFMTFGCLAVVKGREDVRAGFLGGVLFGLAVLAREGLFLALASALMALVPLQRWCSPDLTYVVRRLVPVAGFFLTLMLFFLYLWFHDLTGYWWSTAIGLPKLYAAIFFKDGMFAAVRALLAYIFQFSLRTHIRQTVFALIVMSAAGCWLWALVKRPKAAAQADMLFVALTTGLLMSAALHLNEIFRLATSITVGMGLVFIIADRVRMAGFLFVLLALGLVAGAFGNDNGDYFLPDRAQIKATTRDERIGLFAGQRWSQDVFDYYNWYVDAVTLLQTRNCGLRYFRNETRDAFLEALTPFVQYQLMPVGVGMHEVPLDTWTHKLRPDYDLDERLKSRDILVATVRQPATAEERAVADGHRVFNPFIPPQPAPQEVSPPAGYEIFAFRATPKSWFLHDGLVTVLLAPASCGALPQM